ncbi:MAG: methylcobamide--CoM methyltransferase [Mogibacterium sp.]|nr:methylcobamide--CoM methyltransferase [Mogibacterium sp.]
MGEIREYKCTYSNSVGISAEVTSGLGLEFPDAYMHSGTMQVLAKAIKEHDGSDFCLLPFCRTVEAEAMGAVLNYGDANTGPRAKDPICGTCEDVLALPDVDVTKGRMAELLDACRSLKDQGETVCLEVTGPFTILNALMEPRKVFKAYRKDRDGMIRVLDKLGADLLRYIEAGKEAGVDVFIFSDSAGAPELIGPKFMTQAVEEFYHPFLKKASELMDENCIFLLCPKFTYAVIDTGFGETVEHELEPGIYFLQAMLKMRGKAKIGGQVCIKNIGVRLANGRFRELVLK